jgi:hypothetical protein
MVVVSLVVVGVDVVGMVFVVFCIAISDVVEAGMVVVSLVVVGVDVVVKLASVVVFVVVVSGIVADMVVVV